jgi:hypothetical protein
MKIGVTATIQTQHLLNISQQRYHLIQMLSLRYVYPYIYILLLLLLLVVVVFSLWAGLAGTRAQSGRPVWLWYTAY